MKRPVLFLLALAITGLISAQTATIKVKGEASVKVVPELMNVTIPLEVKRSSYSETSAALTSMYNELEKALVKAGLPEEEIQTYGFSIRENYRYENRDRIMDGYVGSMNITLEAEHTSKNMAALMNTLKQDQFNFGYSLNFMLSEAQKKALLERTIEEAVADGKLKAEILAKSLGVRIISLDEVNFGYLDGSPGVFQPKMRMDMAAAEDNTLELNPREMEIRKEVGLVWKVAE